ncbi:hypothetical protein SLEP1_g7508 [Rubroshorea leprosula]|uniref:Uncharacterized protein n=1 Tax=Rubroshorea leprosula TaxID=152421 RepID=A0AAV5I8E7_9ROSI|nr:hypothetical protein SLEP1_g7508 [Rubroshorea leprosula]
MKVQIPSTTGTKSIIQIVHDLKEGSETKTLPSASKVWEARGLNANKQWKVPEGERILEQLQIVEVENAEEISSAPIPLIEHFRQGLGRLKGGYARGLGIGGLSNRYMEQELIKAREEQATKRADDLEKRISNMGDTIKMQDNLINQLHNLVEDLHNQVNEYKNAGSENENVSGIKLSESQLQQIAAFVMQGSK